MGVDRVPSASHTTMHPTSGNLRMVPNSNRAAGFESRPGSTFARTNLGASLSSTWFWHQMKKYRLQSRSRPRGWKKKAVSLGLRQQPPNYPSPVGNEDRRWNRLEGSLYSAKTLQYILCTTVDNK